MIPSPGSKLGNIFLTAGFIDCTLAFLLKQKQKHKNHLATTRRLTVDSHSSDVVGEGVNNGSYDSFSRIQTPALFTDFQNLRRIKWPTLALTLAHNCNSSKQRGRNNCKLSKQREEVKEEQYDELDYSFVRLLLLLSLFCFQCVFGRERAADSVGLQTINVDHKAKSSFVFNVKSFGAKADGQTDDSKAFTAAWKEACQSKGRVHLIIPRGKYMVGPLKFSGPCRNVSALNLRMNGYLKATTELSKYEFGGGWIQFAWTKGLTLTGGGTFDGQGAKAWPHNKCSKDSNCKLLPTSLKFIGMNKTVIRGISSVNSKFFHIAVVDCHYFKGSKLKIQAPETSPNTDGIHIERSSSVYFSSSHIATGDDCISVGEGNSHVTITSIACGPGHGISVGSLGKYPNEGDVSGLVVRDCTISGTTNGIRIKTWANSPGRSAATNMTFTNIVMNNVTNPIIIDQLYCPFRSCASKTPSKVKLSDIYFKNIRGTSSSQVAVALECSKGIPCQNIYLEDVHLNLASGKKEVTSTCSNVKAKFIGTQIPPPCT